MKLKYKLSQTWLTMGIIWGAISVYLFFRYLPNSAEQFFFIRMVTLVALPILIAIYYFVMPLISYVRVTEDKIIIHRSVIIFNFKIDRKNLDYVRMLNRDLVFYTKDDKVNSIHMDWVNRKDLIDFIKYLQSFVNVYEENSKIKVDANQLI